jgi:hypothetical protein
MPDERPRTFHAQLSTSLTNIEVYFNIAVVILSAKQLILSQVR